jgi:hypothetical protein
MDTSLSSSSSSGKDVSQEEGTQHEGNISYTSTTKNVKKRNRHFEGDHGNDQENKSNAEMDTENDDSIGDVKSGRKKKSPVLI